MRGSNRAVITGGDGIMDTLYGLVDRVEEMVNSAVGEQIEDQQERLRASADRSEGWQIPREEIRSWEDPEGNAAFGVPDDSEYAEQALASEYGTGDAAPAPIIRMGVLSQTADIGWALRERFRSEGF